ncbi:MAG: arginine--tRNA ligase [Patescibacteria group bacterium]
MKELIKKIIVDATKKAGYAIPRDFSIEVPPKSEMGDFATNMAMIVAGRDKISPKEIAEKIVSNISKAKEINKVEIAGPGFINIFIKESIYHKEIAEILKQKEEYGKSNIGKNKKVLVEYISANPTGPLHVGNARGGPIGEAAANLFSFLGYEVERDFYINDIGGQIERFAESLYYWLAVKEDKRIEFPEGGYPGDYIKEISTKIQKEKAEEIKALKDKSEIVELFKKEGLYYMVKQIREDSLLLGIKFDNWVNQSDFQHSGKTEQILKQLEETGATTKKEGALWFKNPSDPEFLDRESVLRKSDEKGTTTYFADDIAYHADKFDRGFSLLVDVWGANHHGHIPRIRAALNALHYTSDKLEIILYQYIRLKKSGKAFSMGKRLGNFVTLRQVIESGVEPDAFKYFILSQNSNTPFDFDLALASDTSEKNPVFYVKYAHARICSILAKAREVSGMKAEGVDFNLLKNKKEIALYKELVKFPELLTETVDNFQIQTLPHYAHKIAGLFHDFYANCQVLTEDKKLTASRLSLVLATKYVLVNALSICGIEAPEKM